MTDKDDEMCGEMMKTKGFGWGEYRFLLYVRRMTYISNYMVVLLCLRF